MPRRGIYAAAMATLSESPAARKRAHPTLVLFALAMGGFAIGTTEFATMSLLPYFAPDLHISPTTAGHVISAYALGVVVGAPTIAVLAAKLARRTLLLILMGLFALGNGLSALAPTYHWMLFFRFLSGLPHGAYFGIAALVAASLVPPARRTHAVGRVMLGLTIATVIGVPAANWLGQMFGWRWGFAIVAVLALVTVGLVALYAPHDPPHEDASAMRELSALGKRQVWLTLFMGAVGFGGLFSVYTYLASTLLAVTKVSPHVVPLVLSVFGVGLTAGNLVVPHYVHHGLMRVAGWLLLFSAGVLALYALVAANIWLVTIDVFLIGCGAAIAIVLQTRLMDVAGEAQALAAALNHSAFNAANALGPLLGGMAIAAGWGWPSTGLVGSALALGGLAIWAVAVWDDRRTARGAERSA